MREERVIKEKDGGLYAAVWLQLQPLAAGGTSRDLHQKLKLPISFHMGKFTVSVFLPTYFFYNITINILKRNNICMPFMPSYGTFLYIILKKGLELFREIIAKGSCLQRGVLMEIASISVFMFLFDKGEDSGSGSSYFLAPSSSASFPPPCLCQISVSVLKCA